MNDDRVDARRARTAILFAETAIINAMMRTTENDNMPRKKKNPPKPDTTGPAKFYTILPEDPSEVMHAALALIDRQILEAMARVTKTPDRPPTRGPYNPNKTSK